MSNMSSAHSKIAVVTGAGGYIASHIVHQLLNSSSPQYNVRGTVRSLSDTEKLAHLFSFQSHFGSDRLTLFEADLLTEGSFDEVMKGAEIVFHCASPFQDVKQDPMEELIRPAKQGTINVLKSVDRAADTVKRVVVTSSLAAVAGKREDPNHVFTERDWNLSSGMDEPYRYSKRLAEEAAWEQAKGKTWSLSVICPSFVMGPPLSKRLDSTSVNLIIDFLSGKRRDYLRDGVNPSCFGNVDVKQVAEAHVLAATLERAKGQRYLMTTNDSMSHLEIADVLRTSGNFEGYSIPTKERGAVERRPKYDHSKAEEELGIKFREPKEYIQEMAQALVDMKMVPESNENAT